MAKIILASSSPRRIELMRRIGLEKCKVIVPHIDEDFDRAAPPEEIAAELSRRKAAEVVDQCGPEDIIIAADTIVLYDGNVLGKPEDEADAFNMLTMLSGSRHLVYTGLTVRRGSEVVTEDEVTSVYMRELTGEEIEAYIATGEPMDKAGAYGIQERGALLVERVDGDFYNVMGLPVCRLSKILERFGIDLLKEDDD